MRINLDHLKPERIKHPQLGWGDGHNGMLQIQMLPGEPRAVMTVLFSRDKEWEHVSVSYPTRAPTWAEMCVVKEMFWDEDETVMQLHVPAADHVNFHEHCLHLWKPRRGKPIPRPPAWMIGPKAKPTSTLIVPGSD